MGAFIIKVVIAAVALWLAAVIVPGIDYDGWLNLLLAGLLLGLVNAFVRPVVTILTLPVTILTLGLFLLVVNAAMIGLVALFLKGFTVSGLVPGILAAIVTGVVSWLGQIVIRDK
jgi:putative membrane protein